MRPMVLTILDGWGYSKEKIGNAIENANTPNIDNIRNNYPSVLLQASGKAVGMTWGEPGNSEVGHLTIGAGRTIFQALSRIDRSIDNGEFYKNTAFIGAVDHVKKNNSKLHIAGLLTSGSVHAHFNHLITLLDFASKNDINNVKLHLFTDGKDSALKEAHLLLKNLNSYLESYPNTKIATIIGRDFAMNRTKNWDLTEKAYNLIVNNEGEKTDNLSSQLNLYYSSEMNDNNIPPTLIDESGNLKENDAIIFLNFREDSMGQITRAFVDDAFDIFKREELKNIYVASMTQYISHPSLHVAYANPEIKNSLTETLSLNNKKQLHIAETEKYAHVTYFLNCFKDKPLTGETDFIIDSLKNNRENPEMKAKEIFSKFSDALERDYYDFIVVNFANADVLAHTGDLNTTVKGVEKLDSVIGELHRKVIEKDGILIITSDHGNAESLLYKGTGESETKHNLSPVPFFLIAKEYRNRRSVDDLTFSLSESRGLLSDIAPTIMELMDIKQPDEMTGQSLLKILTE